MDSLLEVEAETKCIAEERILSRSDSIVYTHLQKRKDDTEIAFSPAGNALGMELETGTLGVRSARATRDLQTARL